MTFLFFLPAHNHLYRITLANAESSFTMNGMRNLLLLGLLLCFAKSGLGQVQDSIPADLAQYYSLSYPERLDSVMNYIRTKPLASRQIFNKVFEIELKAAEQKKEPPLLIAEILGYKMRMEARNNELILLAQTITDLREMINTEGDLKRRKWKELLGKTHIFLAHIAYYKYENKKAQDEMIKAVAIFEELEENFLLSECYMEMSRYSEAEPEKDAYYLNKLDSVAMLIPMNRFIVSGMFFKMNNLTRAGKHQEMHQLLAENKDSIMAVAPYLEYELKNQIAINAINLNDNNKAYGIYKSLVDELHNKDVLPVIFAQIEVVQNFTNLLKRMKRFEEASIYQDTLVSLLKQDYTVLRDETIAESQLKYQQLEDEQKIKELELEQDLAQSKLRTTIFGLLTLFAITLAGFGFWLYRQRQKQRETFLLTSKEKETQQVREKLLTSITHELRTPLSIISGKLESLEETQNKEEHKFHLEVAKRNSNQLVEQINQLLEWNKLEANALSNQPTIGDAEQEMEKTLEALKPMALHKKLEWNIGVKKQNFKGKLDYGKFKTISSNLLSNAIKYAPPKSTIALKLFQDNNELVFSVQDVGPGIPAEHLPKIFDWYYRVANSNNADKHEGFGIGLALSKELAELMNGTLKVFSKEGEGSTFTLSVPFKSIHQEDSSSKQLTSPSANNHWVAKNNAAETTILIVEDHPDLAGHIASLFQRDFNVMVVHTYEEGINMAEIEVPDLIISDIMLPDGSGLDLCKKLKSQLVTDHIPIVMLTARGDEETRFSSLKNKADAFLHKPFNNKELRLTVQNLLQNRRILHLRFGNSKDDLGATEDTFSHLVMQALQENYTDSLFNVDSFAGFLSLSKGQAYRKIRATFDTTPKRLIRDFRLEKAKHLLDDDTLNISEVAYNCGFTSPEYFSTLFREVYKKSPSDYRSSM